MSEDASDVAKLAQGYTSARSKWYMETTSLPALQAEQDEETSQKTGYEK